MLYTLKEKSFQKINKKFKNAIKKKNSKQN